MFSQFIDHLTLYRVICRRFGTTHSLAIKSFLFSNLTPNGVSDVIGVMSFLDMPIKPGL